uniref:Uncharacterized protein n=1 Tax=Aedes albopictus TaxID=7160 RepID=A0A1W7R4U1_AEDAL
MISNKHFRVMGIIYSGLCLTKAFLFFVNASVTIKPTNGDQGETISGFSILVLNTSLVSFIFNAILLFGILNHRVEFIRCYLYFISIIHALIFAGLVIGCIAVGIWIGQIRGETADANGRLAYGMTILVMTVIILLTLQFTLIVWILKGVMRASSNDSMRLVASGDADEMT